MIQKDVAVIGVILQFESTSHKRVSYITLAVSDRRVNHRGLIQSVISLGLVCESAWVGEACIFEIRLFE